MEQILACENSSMSSLYGCVGYAIQAYILDTCKFPDNLFNSVTVSTELATRNIRRSFRSQNANVEMAKRIKPFIILQPTYPTMEFDMPMQGIPLTANFDDLQYRTDARYLFDVIVNYDDGYAMKFKMNRNRIEFDITMIFDTRHRQLDTYNGLKNRLKWENSGIARVALESVIPKRLIAYMSKLSHMDLEEHSEYIPIFLEHLNKYSAYPITYKIRNASATDEWFLYYTHNVVVTFTDLEMDQGQRKNMTEDDYRVTFRAIVDFNFPAVYFVDVLQDRTIGLDLSIKTVEYNSENTEYTPIFSVPSLFDRYPRERNGKQLFGSTIFRTEAAGPRTAEDRVELKCMLGNDHIKVIRAHKAWGMKPETLVDFVVLKNRVELAYETDYYIDWNAMELVVRNPDNDATYRLIIYFDFTIFNDILENTEYHKVNDTSKLVPSVFSPVVTEKEPMRETIQEQPVVSPAKETEPKATFLGPRESDYVEPVPTEEPEEVIHVNPGLKPKPKTADIENKKKIVDLLNRGASVAEIHNAIQQEKVHEEEDVVPYPETEAPPKPEVVYDMKELETAEPLPGKKRFSSTAKK